MQVASGEGQCFYEKYNGWLRMRRFSMEAVGTAFLVLAYGLSSNAYATGFILAALVYGGMQVSGAHFNPAVTFAYFVRGDLSFRTFLTYSLSQLLGAFAASGLLLILTKHVFYVQPPTSTDILQQGIIEVLFTFLIAFAYLSLIPMNARKVFRLNALGVGITLSAAILIGYTISGAVYNPAISIGTATVDYLTIKGTSFYFIPLYLVSSLVGAALAGLMYRYISTD